MLLNLDAKALEVVCAAYLSNDRILIDELNSGVDIHERNKSALGLPTRLVAKTFVFRLLYGGTAYAYSVDPDFALCSRSERGWQHTIDEFYSKYKGIAEWHSNLMKIVGRDGILTMPTGRQYVFLNKRNSKGDLVLPRTQILNYPVQGLGADLMAIVRVSLNKRLIKAGLRGLLVCTVHDSVLIDCPKESIAPICKIVYSVFDDVPRNFKKLFGVEFPLSLGVEIQAGENWGEMMVLDKEIICKS